MAFLDENPAAEMSTADLAAMAGISARALQAGFQELVGMPPSAYLRGVRLDLVHLELASGDHGSVTDVAARWGCFHPGRFAHQYRERSVSSPPRLPGVPCPADRGPGHQSFRGPGIRDRCGSPTESSARPWPAAQCICMVP